MEMEPLPSVESLVSGECAAHFLKVQSELSEQGRRELIAGLQKLVKGSAAAKPAVTQPQGMASSALCSMPEVSFLAPRGSFAIDFAANSVSLRGKAGNIVLDAAQTSGVMLVDADAKTSTALYLIRMESSPNMLLASFKTAQTNTGKTRTTLTALGEQELPREVLQVVSNEKAKREEVFATMLSHSLLGSQAVAKLEDESDFMSSKNCRYLQCNFKNVNEGRLFLMRDGLLFVGSPNMLLMNSQIQQVEHHRINSRTFEVHVFMLPDPTVKKQQVNEFSQISVEDLPAFEMYIKRIKFGASAASEKKPLLSPESASTKPEDEEEEGSEESLSSDDSPYTSSESESDDGEEDGEEQSGGEATMENADQGNSEQEEESDDDSSSSGDSEDDELDGEEGVAELVDEDKFEPDPEDVITDGRKRRRKGAAQ